MFMKGQKCELRVLDESEKEASIFTAADAVLVSWGCACGGKGCDDCMTLTDHMIMPTCAKAWAFLNDC